MTLDLAIIGSRGFPSTYGGFETLVRYLSRHLVRLGHRLTVYSRTDASRTRTWQTEGVRCIRTPGLDTKSLSTLSFGLTSTIDASIRRYDAALVLNVANGFWIPMLRLAGVPFALNPDGFEWERAKWNAAGRRAFKVAANLTAKSAPALVCDSHEIARFWENTYGRSSAYIPYGAEIVQDTGTDLLRGVGISSSGFLLVVARLVPENNVELALDAIKDMGDGAPLTVIVGETSPTSQLGRRLRRLSAAGNTRWLGHVDDPRLLDQLWNHCGVYIHGHSVGGTNPALLQALGAGAPTLALDTVFNREVLADDRQLFSPNRSELAARLSQLIASPDLQRVFRANGRAIVSERYSWPRVCARYTELLVTMANERRRARRRSFLPGYPS